MIPSTVSQLAAELADELAAELATELAAELAVESAAELATELAVELTAELAAIGEHRYAPDLRLRLHVPGYFHKRTFHPLRLH